MPRYRIVINVEGARLDLVRKKALEAFGKDISAQVAKIESQPSRQDRLNEIAGSVRDASSDVESLRDELQEWKDNMPESLQNGGKADELDEAISQLEELARSLDDVNFDDVSFPAAF